jgi:hypothetical protein
MAGLVAGLVLGGAGGGLAALHGQPLRHVTVKPNSIVTFAGSIDVACSFKPYTTDYFDPGPVIYCYRASVTRPSRGVVITRFHVGVTNADNPYMIHAYPRLP